MMETSPPPDAGDPSNVDPPAPLAEPPKRLIAAVLDVLLLGAAFELARIGIDAAAGGAFPWPASGAALFATTLATGSLPAWLYFALLDSGTRRGTLGKRLFRVRVAGASGRPPTFGRSLLRTAIKLLPLELAHASLLLPVPAWIAPEQAFTRVGFTMSMFLQGAWLASMLLTPKSQAVHDTFARTFVVKRGG